MVDINNKDNNSDGQDEEDGHNDNRTTNVDGNTVILVDYSAAEEVDMNGTILYSINAQNEMCFINMPGKIGQL